MGPRKPPLKDTRPPIDWIESYLWVRDKRGQIVPFVLNDAQRRYVAEKARLAAEGYKYILVLKSRREGITTLEQAISYERVCRQPHYQAVTLAQDHESTAKIFEIARLFHEQGIGDSQPSLIRTNRRELKTYTNSSFFIGTAGSKSFGRGTTLQRFHGSEVAFWRGTVRDVENLVAGLTEAASHGEGVLETTANGARGWLYEEWNNPESEFGKLFVPWWWGRDNWLPLVLDQRAGLAAALTDDERYLVEEHGVELERIKWRRRKARALRKLMAQEYPESAESAFLTTGLCLFELAVIDALLLRVPAPVVSRLGGQWIEWEEPGEGREYAIGADTALGVDGGDYSAACVLDYHTGEQVAELHGRWKPKDFGDLLYDLGMRYNGARLAVEREFTGHAVIERLMERGYSRRRLYKHHTYDAKTGKTSQRTGWSTNGETRAPMLAELEGAIADGSFKPKSRRLLEECRVFDLTRYNELGRPRFEAEDGYHDDLVLAAGIAWQARKMKLYEPSLTV